ncbi:uncharacterized protein LOC144584430 isoform X2 [Pogona vitticeps]
MPLLFFCFSLGFFLLYPPRSLAQMIGGIPGSSILPEKCGTHEFFSLASAQCVPCGQKLVRSPDGLSCVCVAGLNETKEPPLPSTCPGCGNVAPSTLWESMFLDAAFLDCNDWTSALAVLH